MILVTSATGQTGRYIVQNLTRAGVPVRAMSRDPEKARALPGFDRAEIVAGDPAVPESLEAAFAGVRAVMLTPPAAPGWQAFQENMIAALRRAGVRRVVKMSVVAIDAEPVSAVSQGHRDGELALEAAGVSWTHLRAHSFMQNIPNFFLPLSGSDGTFFRMCVGEGRMPLVDVRDVANAAAAVLTQAGHEEKAYTLTGPEELTFAEAAARIQAATGRPLRYVDHTRADYVAALTGVGMPADLAEAIGIMYGEHFRNGRGAGVDDTLGKLIGRRPRTIEDFAHDWAAGRL